jgi:hypothetical protein
VLLRDYADALARLGAVARRSRDARPPGSAVTSELDELVRFCALAGDHLATVIEDYR